MLYQATRQFGDFVNGIEIPYGGYVETDCIKWVQRIGPFLRPLSPSEKPKGKIISVNDTLEDAVVEVVIKEDINIKEEVVEEPVIESDVTEESVVEATPLRRKIKPLRNS